MGIRSEDIRSVAVVAHGGAGKTSLVEAMLFDAGATNRMGTVENGNTVMDFTPEEQKRQISISTSVANFEKDGKTVFVLDVPGYADFVGEMGSALRVADSAIFVVSATDGVEVQTDKAWSFSEKFKTTGIFVVNKMDRENADYGQVVDQIRNELTKKALAFFLPIGEGTSFKGIVDILAGAAYTYETTGSGKFTKGEVPADMADKVEEYKAQLIETIVEEDEELMMRYLDGETIGIEEITPLVHKGIVERNIFPIIPVSAKMNIGTHQLIDLIINELPNPLESRVRVGTKDGEEVSVAPDPNGPFSGICFKVMVDPYVGKLSFIRVNSGSLTVDNSIYNVNEQEEERISSFKIMQGKEGKDVKEITTGMIVALPKLQTIKVGDSLGVKGGPNIIFPPIEFPRPVFSVAVIAPSRADEDKLGNAMRRMLEEDPTIQFEKNPETNDNVLSGMGNMHIDIVLARIKDRYGVNLETKTPQVPYRETIRRAAKAQGKHKKQSGGHGQYGDAHVEFSPTERGEGFIFEDKIVGGAIPKQYIPAVEKGIREALVKGVLAGFPTVDFRATLFFGSYHDVDSSEMAFKTAAHLAFKKGMVEASPVLLEPVMNVEVVVADQYLGDVMGDFNTRRGRIMGVDSLGHLQIVKAQAPLSEMFEYSIQLRSMTSGRGNFTMEFSHYDVVPEDITKKIVAARKDFLATDEE